MSAGGRKEDAPAHVVRYEQLRPNAAEGRSLVSRLGLTVLLQQGLAAWLEQWSKLPASVAAPPAECSRLTLLPNDCSLGVIQVLATMVLSHVKEVQV